MTYPETIKYLESFIDYEKIPAYPYKESLKLERIEGFLDIIGNPHNSLKCIHIAGTKGKGSTCAFITYILREAGFKVGLYTSPHLSDFRERIRILEQEDTLPVPARPAGRKSTRTQEEFEGMISEKYLAGLVEKFRPEIEKYNHDSIYGALSFFEVYTALAFVYFKEKKTDFAVLETGLGGRLDATNVVNPCVCAITPISYEHTQKLGNTLKEIATQKAGIIKEHKSTQVHKYTSTQEHQLTVISAPQKKEAAQVIRDRCKEVGAKLYEIGHDIKYKKTQDGFEVSGVFARYPGLKIKLLGEHQLVNATVALAVIEALRAHNIKIGISSVRGGLYKTLWPGRCEIVSRKPFVLLDGAQNAASSKVLKETIIENLKYKKLILVLGISKDKDIKGVCNQLHAFSDEVILTKADNPRASDPLALAGYFPDKITHITNSVREAKSLARSIYAEEDLILVTGSLFILGEFRDGAF